MVDHALAGGLNGFSRECRQEAHAVFGHGWSLFARDVRNRSEDIHQGDELVARGAGLKPEMGHIVILPRIMICDLKNEKTHRQEPDSRLL